MKLTADPQLDDLPAEDQAAFVLTVRCPACGRGPGRFCIRADGTSMSYLHHSRTKAAREPYRLHVAQKS